MRGGSAYLGGGRYIQQDNAAALLGTELRLRACRKAFIVGGSKSLGVSRERIGAGLREEGVEYVMEEFAGHCTIEKCTEVRKRAAAAGCDVIVGVGGGKVLDTAKYVADQMNAPVVTVPTSAATCAAYAVLSVIYSESGDVLYSTFHGREVQTVLVDMELIVHHCPARMLAAGIADSAAKYPEILFSTKYAAEWEKSVLPAAALALAKFNWDELEARGPQAVRDVAGGRNSADVEDCVCQSIALTATVSSLVSGGRQLAIAHTFYDAICKHFKEQQRTFLHGEIVSAGIPLQMYVNGADGEAMDRARKFLRAVGTPVCLRDLGIDGSADNIDIIFSYISRNMELGQDRMTARVRNGLEQLAAR
jgi:glycerol dehydrogenase